MFNAFNSKGSIHNKVVFVSQSAFTLDGKPLYYIMIEDMEGRVIDPGTYVIGDEIDFNDYYVFWWDEC
jgi:hypothetical protein